MSRFIKWLKKYKAQCFVFSVILILLVSFMSISPKRLFKDVPCSTVVTDRNGELLGARIADDGQWRFPPTASVPDKFSISLIQFEDRMFRWHCGVNPASLIRACIQNIKEGRIISGGSTITMQVVRIAQQTDKPKKRTLWRKIVEAVWAVRLELSYSKEEILALYASYAPFGGNVVGLQAASWRYFGRSPEDLSWSEAAMLAVLPNAPAMIHPGKNRETLLSKRNRLLHRLHQKGYIDTETMALACEEPLPGRPVPLPQYCPHLCDYYHQTAKGRTTRTCIDISLQRNVENIMERWGKALSKRGINDLASVVIDIESGEYIAYCGNIDYNSGREGSQVDAATARRSTGSILKPMLYCAMLQDGEILPNTLLPDIPININGFSPQNFDKQFYGAVPAATALSRSLNVPSVHLMRKYGVARFYELLKKCGMNTLDRSASHYGLSLILGGAEGRLAEITKIYADMALAMTEKNPERLPDRFPLRDRCAIYYTLEALSEVNRPDEMDWRNIISVHKVAWKTGTSYGFRDAWSIGVTTKYAVGVWAGNAGGEGVPQLTGASVAGPVMFDIFNLLPSSQWFPEPDEDEYTVAEVCNASGHLKGQYCDEYTAMMLPKKALRSTVCPYHRPVMLTADDKCRCTPPYPGSHTENLFLLPPAMEWFYKKHHPEYRSLPPLVKGTSDNNFNPMEFIYPESGSTLYIPRQLDGSIKGITLNLAHSNPEKKVYWHLDNEYLSETQFIHQLQIVPPVGSHNVTVTDEDGFTLSVSFTIAEGRDK